MHTLGFGPFLDLSGGEKRTLRWDFHWSDAAILVTHQVSVILFTGCLAMRGGFINKARGTHCLD